MITKNELMENTDDLILKLRGEQMNIFVLLMLPAMGGRVDRYTDQCIDFQKKIQGAPDDHDSLLDLYKEYVVLERTTKRRAMMLSTIPSLFILYFGFAGIFWLVTSVDIPDFIENTLGVKAPGKLISLGVAGAFLYFATTGLKLTTDTNNEESKQYYAVLNWSIRIFLAVVVPIILVVLFFNEDGSVKNFELTPEILSFICGYSAKIVVELFNKIVEKISKAISAI